MSSIGSTSSSQATQSEATVPFSTRNKVGFVLAILLAVPNLFGPLFPTPDGEVGPPMLVLALGAVLGVVTIAAVVLGWARGTRAAIRVASAAIIVSAVTALPAFFAPDVPAGLVVIAAVSVLTSIVAVALMLAPARTAARAEA
ncbi:MAG: hypothetical protein MUF35_02840 [Candidatus Nanopelagicales bacterium]|jgi:hypothetical protein|nr:hypothetical protein [Candidatus Nanopelagicales bacterium]